AVVEPVPLADRALQLGNTRHGRVAREVMVQRVVRRCVDWRGRRKIRLAGAEIDDIDALATQSIHGGGHRNGGRAGAARCPGRRLHRRQSFWRSRCSTRSGTSPCTRPPRANTSLISRELIYVYCSAGIMKIVSICAFNRWFIKAIWNSNSKSETAR